MAVWQFSIEFLPQGWLDSGGNVHALLEPEGGFDASPAWRSFPHATLEQLLGQAGLSKGKSYHSNLTVWGTQPIDSIQLWRRREKVQSVTVRFDLRQPNMELFQHVIRIAQERHLAIVALETMSIVPLDVLRLLRAAAESRAAHFVLDPSSFLSEVEAANRLAT